MRIPSLYLRCMVPVILGAGAVYVGCSTWLRQPVSTPGQQAVAGGAVPMVKAEAQAEVPPVSIALPAPDWVRRKLPGLLHQAMASGDWTALQAALAEEMQRHPLETVEQLLAAAGLDEMRSSLLLNALEHCPASQARAVADLIIGKCKDRGEVTAALKVLLATTAQSDTDMAMGLLPLLNQLPDPAQGIAGLVGIVVQRQGRAGITSLARPLAGSDIWPPPIHRARCWPSMNSRPRCRGSAPKPFWRLRQLLSPLVMLRTWPNGWTVFQRGA
jgi:hypothetical protein